MKIVLKILLFFLLLTMHSCERNAEDVVPGVRVYLKLGVYNELRGLGVGEVMTITPDTLNEGYSFVHYDGKVLNDREIAQKTYGNGILLYRKDVYYYIAFDLTCPYRARTDYCSLDIDGRGVLPICKCCKSVFFLDLEGMPSKDSKTDYGLRTYKATLTDNQTMLIVSN